MSSSWFSSSATLLLLAATVAAQNPNGDGQRGGRGQRGGGGQRGGFDPGSTFDQLDANKDGFLSREEAANSRFPIDYDDFLRRAGATNGQLSRDGFTKAMQQRMEE